MTVQMENDALLEDLEHDAICRECIIEKYTHSVMTLPMPGSLVCFYCTYFQMTQFLFFLYQLLLILLHKHSFKEALTCFQASFFLLSLC